MGKIEVRNSCDERGRVLVHKRVTLNRVFVDVCGEVISRFNEGFTLVEFASRRGGSRTHHYHQGSAAGRTLG